MAKNLRVLDSGVDDTNAKTLWCALRSLDNLVFALLLVAASAQAQPVILEHRIPVTTEVGTSISMLGGADAWQDAAQTNFQGGGASGQAAASAAMRYGFRRTRLSASWSGLAQGWMQGFGVDGQLMRVGLHNDRGPGLVLSGRASAVQYWWELGAGPSLELGSVARVNVVVSERRGVGVREWGPMTQALVSIPVHPRVRIVASARQYTFVGPTLPNLIGAGAGVRWNPALDLTLDLGTSAMATWDGVQTSHAGLPAAGATVMRGYGTFQWWIDESVALRADVGLEAGAGTTPYTRMYAMSGLHVSVGRVDAPPAVIPEGEVLLRFDVDNAVNVSVAGTFTDWQPMAMTRVDDRWELQLDLPPGVHEYVYLVDGAPIVPPEAATTRPDDFGGLNGVLVVSGGAL